MKNWWTKRHVHPCNGASIFGGLALRIVEICGDSNDGMLHFFAQVVLRRLLVENEMKIRPTEQTQHTQNDIQSRESDTFTGPGGMRCVTRFHHLCVFFCGGSF